MEVQELRIEYLIEKDLTPVPRRHWGGRFRPLTGFSARKRQAAYGAERLSLIASKPLFRRMAVKENTV